MPLTASLLQARRIIEMQLELLSGSHLSPHDIAPLMLWGQPGLGKSQMVREVCASHGIGFIDVRLTQMEPVDLRGLPVANGDTVNWLIASTWPRDSQSRGIVLFDELPASDRSLQVAAYELILDRRLGDLYSLPPGWLIVAAGNRIEDQAVSRPMSSALANRFLHVELEADIEAWCRYGLAKGLHPDVIAFLRFKPDYLLVCDDACQRGWPSPRSWERVSALLANTDLDDALLHLMLHGLVGQSAATEFMAFREWGQQSIDVPAMLRGEVAIVIPERDDQQLAFCAAMVHYLWQGHPSTQAQRLAVFLAIGLRLGSDLATLMLMDALRHEDSDTAQVHAEQVFGHPDFGAWLDRHGIPMGQLAPEKDIDLPQGRFTLASTKAAAELAMQLGGQHQGGAQ